MLVEDHTAALSCCGGCGSSTSAYEPSAAIIFTNAMKEIGLLWELFVTIVCLAFDPFLQAIIHYTDGLITDSNITSAQTKRLTRVGIGDVDYGHGHGIYIQYLDCR